MSTYTNDNNKKKKKKKRICCIADDTVQMRLFISISLSIQSIDGTESV